VLLLALGALGVWFGAPSVESVRAAAGRLAESPIAVLAIVLGGALGLVATESVRLVVIARLLGVRVSARDSIDTTVANHVMTAITPNIGLGEPAVAYVLARRGVPWDAAVAIPFIKLTTSVLVVFAAGTIIIAAGEGPPDRAVLSGLAIAVFGAIALVTAAIIAIGASTRAGPRTIQRLRGWLGRRRRLATPAWHDRLDRAAGVATRAVERLAGLRRAGWRGVAILIAVHAVYYASYIAPIVGLACVLGDPPVLALALRSIAYLCFMFAIPTPGGAGPTEAAAGLFFGDVVPPIDAIAIVVVFRAATFYLQVAIGVVWLPLVALRSR
jgi:uncharacterized protein (TIRG00374 family)